MNNKDYIENPAFKRMVLRMDAGIAGTDTCEAYLVPVDTTQEELDDYAWDSAKSHAESFGIYPLSEYVDSDEVSEEELGGDEYSENIEGWFEEYDAKEHEGKLIFGSNDDFTWSYL